MIFFIVLPPLTAIFRSLASRIADNTRIETDSFRAQQ